MDIQQADNGKKGKFFVEINGKPEAEMTYVYAGKHTIIIDHTALNDALRGEGVGYKLVEAAVSFARETELKINPLCPFAHAAFKKHAEYQDVLIK
ncbi:GNAT family N-acetyltransferase [Siansivirga zeaxanthinifaciens]|uniref:Acyl-CoA acyltransferase n=1 Tax=Siansivirga zeaxanthinifaciens CC-SAMT-1 TaxID=1454006 RepID=A0A0C5WMQ3_9FLAO|nr:GNAT family N-acetyltransferase [Siansivirga zeaxanthinifaciens]AJR04155.1 acyl-CoA acyltransferase [Siansivirga zeaxanthinifaciens CC-SAMT-1]